MSDYDREDRAMSILQMLEKNKVIKKKKKITTQRNLKGGVLGKGTTDIPREVGTHTKDRLDAFPSMSFGLQGFANSPSAGNDKLSSNAPQPIDY